MFIEGWPTPRGVDHTTIFTIHWLKKLSQGPKTQKSLMAIRSRSL
jgi:hypothetical protein